MKKIVVKDKKNRVFYYKKEQIIKVYKALIDNLYIDKSIHYCLKKRVENLNVSLVKIKTRCFITGKKRGIVKKMRSVRSIIMRKYYLGWLEGFRRIMW